MNRTTIDGVEYELAPESYQLRNRRKRKAVMKAEADDPIGVQAMHEHIAAHPTALWEIVVITKYRNVPKEGPNVRQAQEERAQEL